MRRMAEETARLGDRAMIVAGRHFLESAAASLLLDDLACRGVEAYTANPIAGEPDVTVVDELAAFARGCSARVVVAVGGGSAIDAAKAAGVLAVNDGKTEDYQFRRSEIINPPLPLVAAPTTAGTGSEATRVSVLSNTSAGVKRSISHPLMTPAAVVLDPELTVSLDARMTTLTALDAFAHAIESAVSRNANPYTRSIALAAIEQLAAHLPVCLREPGNLDARLGCLVGSCFAGLSMQAGLGASHSLAPAVCVVAGIRHSEAIAALLPHTIRTNSRRCPGTYSEVEQALSAADAAVRIEELCAAGGVAAGLAPYGLSASDWSNVLETMNRYASHRQTNPAEVTDDLAREMFERAVG